MSSSLAATVEGVEDQPRRTHRFWMLLALVTTPVLALDQLSKLYINSHFRLYETVPLVPNWLDVTYTLNPGAAFSLFATMPPGFRSVFFIVLSIVAIIVLAVLLTRPETSLASSISFLVRADPGRDDWQSDRPARAQRGDRFHLLSSQFVQLSRFQRRRQRDHRRSRDNPALQRDGRPSVRGKSGITTEVGTRLTVIRRKPRLRPVSLPRS